MPSCVPYNPRRTRYRTRVPWTGMNWAPVWSNICTRKPPRNSGFSGSTGAVCPPFLRRPLRRRVWWGPRCRSGGPAVSRGQRAVKSRWERQTGEEACTANPGMEREVESRAGGTGPVWTGPERGGGLGAGPKDEWSGRNRRRRHEEVRRRCGRKGVTRFCDSDHVRVL